MGRYDDVVRKAFAAADEVLARQERERWERWRAHALNCPVCSGYVGIDGRRRHG